MIEILTDLSPGVLGVRASGLVTSEDLTQVTERVDAALGRGERLSLYVELADDFAGLDPAARRTGRQVATDLWLRHRSRFERFALVTDNDWVRNYLSAFGGLLPGEVRVFESSRRGEARSWLTQRVAA
jgi:SpoIIAA-like